MLQKFVYLYEEFNPAKSKEKISKRVDAIKKRMNSNKEKMAKAAKSKDTIRQEIIKTRMEIENFNMKRAELQNRIVDLRVKRKKERIAKLQNN